MKYLKYNALLVALLAFNVVLWGQEPCTDMPVKPTKGEEIKIPTIVTPILQSPLGVLEVKCPEDISITIPEGENGVDVTWNDATFTPDPDCQDPTVVLTQQVGEQPSGTNFAIGEYTYHYIATDNCNNTATCEFKIWVGHYKPIVIFVHGKGGDDSSWSQATAYVENTGDDDLKYKARSVEVSYNEDDGLIVAGTSLNTTLEKDVLPMMENASKTNRKKNFIIAHSQGGIVAQYAEMNLRNSFGASWDKNTLFGGLVTFASSSKGAFALNSLLEDDNGVDVFQDNDPDTKTRFENFASKASEELKAGKITDINNALPGFLGLNTAVSGVVSGLIDLVATRLPNSLISSTLNNTTRGYIVNPIVPQSVTVMNTFFSGTSSPAEPIPKVAFYGVITPENEKEQGEMIWRAAFWAQNAPNGYPSDAAVFFGSANAGVSSDNGLGLDGQYDANRLKNEYIERRDVHTAIADNWQNSGWYNFWYRKAVYKHRQAAYDWGRGVNWFLTVNDQYKTLIGAKTYESVDACQCECDTYSWANGFGGTSGTNTFDIPCADDCSDYEFSNTYATGGNGQTNCKRLVSTESVSKQSDGLVLAESASYIAGATVNENSTKPDGSGNFTKDDFVLYGSIHHQMRNDANVRLKLGGVKVGSTNEWTGGLYTGYYGAYFKITD